MVSADDLIFFCIADQHCVEFHLYYEMRIGRTTLCSGHFYLHPPLGSVHLLMHFWRITIIQPAVQFLIYIQPVVGRPFYFHHSIFLLLFFYSSKNPIHMYRAQHTIWLDVTKQEGWKKGRIIKTRSDKTGRRVISSRTSATVSFSTCMYLYFHLQDVILIGPPREVLNNWIEDIFIFFSHRSAFDQSNSSKLSAFAQEEWQKQSPRAIESPRLSICVL